LRTFRILLCWIMIAILPALLAQTQEGAVLYTKGLVWVNNSPVPGSTAIFPGNTIQTFEGALTNIVVTGSSIIVQPDSIVKFQGTYLELEHGSVRVQTTSGMAVHANCLRVGPSSNVATLFEVTDVNWTAHISAIKQDVNVTQFPTAGMSPQKIGGLKHITVAEGQILDHDDHCKGVDQGSPPDHGGVNTKYIGAAAAGGALLICLVVHCFGGSSPPPSPSKPCSGNETCN